MKKKMHTFCQAARIFKFPPTHFVLMFLFVVGPVVDDALQAVQVSLSAHEARLKCQQGLHSSFIRRGARRTPPAPPPTPPQVANESLQQSRTLVASPERERETPATTPQKKRALQKGEEKTILFAAEALAFFPLSLKGRCPENSLIRRCLRC